MLLLDDILLAPVHGLFWIFREIGGVVDEELTGEPSAITAELTQLYMMLEAGKISAQEFDAREQVLLDRLDALGPNGDSGGTEDDEQYEQAVAAAEAARGPKAVDNRGR